MFSSKPKFTPGVPFEVQRVYDLLSPKPKELLQNAGERRFISEGEIGVFNHKERRTKRRYLYLFNDVLLITKKEGKKSYWLKIFISLGPSLRVEDVPDTATKYKVEFRIYALKKTIILFSRTEDEKHRWLQLIRDCIANKKDEDEPPAYAPDSPVVTGSASMDKEADIQIADVSNYTSFENDEDEASEEFNPEFNRDAQDIMHAEKPLPATPASTPVQGSSLEDFSSTARRPAPPIPEADDGDSSDSDGYPTVDSSYDYDPFADSQPLGAQQPASGNIMQPIPANTGFSDFAQSEPSQMFTQDAFDPHLSVEEQMKRLSMHAPSFRGPQ